MNDPHPAAHDRDPSAAYFVRAGSVAARALAPGITAEATTGAAMTLSVVTFEPEAVIADHAHPHEQMGLLISGRLEFTVGDRTEVLEAGDVWRIPGGVAHRARAIGGPAVALDVFHPVRDDFRS